MARKDSDKIIIRGARVHNLKNISLDLPRNKLIVFTGVSGSGKSSLAFDTIYAEGQRRYVESLSSYARQFLERMDKPDVDLIQGISPAMAIEQKTNTRNPRSTVGTTTEIYDYLRLLFARIGKTYCHNCGRLVTRDSVQSVLKALAEAAQSKAPAAASQQSDSSSLKLYVTFPLPVHPKETLEQAFANLKKEGFFRVVVNGAVIDLNEGTVPAKTKASDVLVLVDRLIFTAGAEKDRFADAIETAFASGSGRATVILMDAQKSLHFNQNFECAHCHIAYEEPDPRLFSFNNPFGACPECQGFGRAVGIDMDLVVPDKSKTLREGAVQPWATPKFRENLDDLIRVAQNVPGGGVQLDVPYAELTERERKIVLDGYGEFHGVYKFFRKVERKAYKIYYRVLLSRYRGYTTCQACLGDRLRREALNVKIEGKTIAGIVQMTISRAHDFFQHLELTPFEFEIARRILSELKKRLSYLNKVGIGYLTLDRLSSTLSGGESQRINLATSLGSSLVGAMYVLDEPSIGLHPRDNEKLINVLKALRDLGNTVVVVEHDADMMKASDVIVDLGPRAGEFGGEVIFNGPSQNIIDEERSITGAYLSGKRKLPLPKVRRFADGTMLQIVGATEHNLKNIDVNIPLHLFVCITGVSGSGKSTLVHDVLYAGLRRLKGEFSDKQGRCRSIEGHDHISAVELVDQSPIGRTPRSNPITYIQVFDQIRNLFAVTQAAKVHGFKPGHFSFNVPGGRCETCEGDGVIKVEMQFLADLYLVCDACKGKRYKQEVLEIRYKGKNIDDILSMTVAEAIQFFGSDATGRKIAQRLKVLEAVGLGYIRLGQPATSLSGGEAQRIKLAAHLDSPVRDQHTLFIFDEPTTGLHFDDIAKLVACFNALIDAGHSVVIIEHNLDVIKCADYVIDLGPEAGDEGGGIVGEGTPEELAQNSSSYTARFLRPYLKR
jgi:excinuclease ABC subunit A